jgi:ABC-2 type transport system ATP-binding protein
MPLRLPSLLAAVVLAATALTALAPAATAQGGAPRHTHAPATVTSPADGVAIDIEVYKPATASADAPVPVLLHGPGWSGSKTSADGAFQAYLDAGYGVVSITPRGFGASGGQVTVMDPDLEGQDYIAVLDHIAGLDWVARESRVVTALDGTRVRIQDPLLGAMGGSYGGGYQYLVALNELATKGYTRMDGLSPQITWYDLNDALAPAGVPRSAWLSALYALGARDVAPYITEGFAYGIATGNYPDGSVPGTFDLEAEFAQHGPSHFRSRGIRLDIPVLIRQGFSDNLFNFNQAWSAWSRLLTRDAREASTLIGYNGGHALPTVAPAGTAAGSDACVPDYTKLEIAFYDALFAGEDTRVLGDPLHYTTATGTCLRLEESDVALQTRRPLDPTGLLPFDTATATPGAAPIHVELPSTAGITVAGVPQIVADVQGVGVDARAYVALSVGTSAADARVLQHNVLPIRTTGGVVALQDATFDLPGVAADLADGERLYLTITGTSDMFFGHGSRTPGAITLSDVRVQLPVVEPGAVD